MAITINGTTGFDSDSSLGISTNETNAITVDSSQNVGIGETSPDEPLHITASDPAIKLQDSDGTDQYSIIKNAGGNSIYDAVNGTGSGGDHIFRAPTGSVNEHVRITSSGNLGVGTNSPSEVITARGDIFLEANSTAANSGQAIYWQSTTSGWASANAHAAIHGKRVDGSNGYLRFDTRSSGTTAERARFDQYGRLLVGDITHTTSASTIEGLKPGGGSNVIKVQSGSASANNLQNNQEVVFAAQGYTNENSRQAKIGVYMHSGISNAAGYIFLDQQDGGNSYLWPDNNGVFRISGSGSHIGTDSGSVVGAQTSDERLKNVGENVAYGLSEVLQLQPKQYAFKTSPDTNKLGFIAQEVLPIIPEAVFDTNEELEGHQEGDSTKLGMEYVQLIPVLVNAIKEQQAVIETLETVNTEQATTIASFEARISALEGGN